MPETKAIEDVVLDWLREANTDEERTVGSETPLLELEVLDSLSILQLVGFLEERFELKMPLEEFVPDNFATPKTVAEMVARNIPSAA